MTEAPLVHRTPDGVVYVTYEGYRWRIADKLPALRMLIRTEYGGDWFTPANSERVYRIPEGLRLLLRLEQGA